MKKNGSVVNRLRQMKSSVIIITLLVILVPVTLFFAYRFASSLFDPSPPSPEEQDQIEQAILQAINEETRDMPVFLLFKTQIDQISISKDGEWATAWLIPIDPDTDQIVPTEPGLVILQREQNGWRVILPSNPQWILEAQSVPTDLIDDQQRSNLMQQASVSIEALTAGPYTGYRLPWAGGETRALTQSVGHDRYTPSGNAHFAFDFATGGYPSGTFNIHAAKAGVVSRARWTQENGDPSEPGNYIVLQDSTTSPTTFQLYLHLVKDSIPPELRAIGTPVSQGQFLAVADDTGVSTGNHLHFMVHTSSVSYWGTSVDITFDDVAINGGRPRISSDLPYCKSTDVCTNTQTNYVSGNFLSPDHTPPAGAIVRPLQGNPLDINPFPISGWAVDSESGLASAQFLARYSGSWHPIGNPLNGSSFSINWDLCADQVPDGPVSLALQLRDFANNQSNNLPGLIHVIKNFSCPASPPTCQPNANQIALFADSDFKGSCIVLGVGNYLSSALGALGSDNASSILTGSNVLATLFTDNNYQGRSETLSSSDSNLSDNRIGSNSVSSLKIQSVSSSPIAPVNIWPSNGMTYPTDASYSLVWMDAGGGLQFQARLVSGSTQVDISPWQTSTVWHLNSTMPGSYTWQVKSKNSTGESNWSNSFALNIQAGSPPATPALNVPFVDDMETQSNPWIGSNYWDKTNSHNHTPGGSISWSYDTNSAHGYDTGVPNSGYLNSPPINLPPGSQYFLRFWYLYETEGSGIQWDQRWVQISVDSGAFTNLLQLSDDVPNVWLQSPSISLASYAGHTVKVRFYFATLDSLYNYYLGWYIDDFSITSGTPPTCGDTDNSITQATLINYGSTTNAVICPEGDVDYYRFQANLGDQIGARIVAQSLGSSLDSYLYLLDSDGSSVLAENDDQVLYERTDSFLSYRIIRAGTYYLKVRSWDHPTSGGSNYAYSISLFNDSSDPSGVFVVPPLNSTLTIGSVILQVSAQDTLSGVSHVEFFWHSSDWSSSDWNFLGDDWDGSDGWESPPFNVATVGDPSSIGFFARIYDWAGNWAGTGFWNDKSPVIILPFLTKP
jgi:murein DD-endopeptidase MepM/ murein hydrolase activator NlpD